MKTTRGLSMLAGVAAVSLGCVGADQAVAQGRTVPYLLRPGTQFFEGCLNECRCLVHWCDDARGAFDLAALAPDEHFANFAVTNARIDMPELGWHYTQAAGTTGHYRLGGDPGLTHQLQLDLSWEGFTNRFDSGLAPVTSGGGTPDPVIVVSINRNRLECYDTVFSVAASRVSDWDASGARTPQDVFAFISDYFRGRADADADGVTSTDDIFVFLADFFSPG